MLQTVESSSTSLLLLGRFGLKLESGARMSVSSKKGCALLAYLAMQPEYTATRERLATLLWGDRSDELARHNLRQCLVSLRRELPPAVSGLVLIEDGSVGLNEQRLAVDAREFAALADSSEPDALARACDLYLGPFLSGLNVESEAFDEWVAAERARLESTASLALISHARHADMAGLGSRAIGAIERLIAIDPLREDWHRQALRLYARHQGRDAALAKAQRLAVLMKAELDVDVEAATKALVGDIRSGGIAPASSIAITDTARPIAITDAAGSNVVGDGERTHAGELNSTAPAVRRRHLAATMPTMAAIGLFVAGTLLIGQSSLNFPWSRGGVAAKSNSGPAATDPSWNSPMPWPSSAAGPSALAARGITAIMVWPFTSFSGGDDADQHLADAITDDLIASLSRFPALRVISRMTAIAYRGRNADVAAVGSDLGVRYIVEGSVRSFGNVMRINIELIDAATRLQVWGDRFERDEARLSTVQDEIVARLARELEVGVASAQSRRSDHERAGEPEVAQLLAKGLMAYYRGAQAETLNQARAYYQGALERDPKLVPALIGVAAPEITGSINFIFDAEPSLKRAATFLGRAEQLDPVSPNVRYWTGLLQKARGTYESALHSLYSTIEINPSYTPAYVQIGSVLTQMGRSRESMEPIVYGMRLSPNDPAMSIWTQIAGQAEIDNGRYSAALEWFRRSAELAPNNPNVHRCLAATYALLGDRANAVAQLAEFKRLSTSAATQHSRDQKLLANEAQTSRRLLQGFRLALALAP